MQYCSLRFKPQCPNPFWGGKKNLLAQKACTLQFSLAPLKYDLLIGQTKVWSEDEYTQSKLRFSINQCFQLNFTHPDQPTLNERKSEDSIKSSEILLFPDKQLMNPCFCHFCRLQWCSHAANVAWTCKGYKESQHRIEIRLIINFCLQKQ